MVAASHMRNKIPTKLFPCLPVVTAEKYYCTRNIDSVSYCKESEAKKEVIFDCNDSRRNYVADLKSRIILLAVFINAIFLIFSRRRNG